jgi:uncharacterized protein YqjF (DUF2071 family)
MCQPKSDSTRRARRELGRSRPVMHQHWRDLLFLHWEFSPEVVEATLPTSLRVDTFGGKAYVGIVPFFMSNIRLGFLPPVSVASAFQELNLRTYVRDAKGTSRVWFYSLDSANPLAVAVARRFFHLPYRRARMGAEREHGMIRFWSQVRGRERSEFEWERVGPTDKSAASGSLDFFLVERYLLYAIERRGRLLRGRVRHAPYRLEPANVVSFDAALFSGSGLQRPSNPPGHQVASRGVDVDIFALNQN